MSPSVDCTHYCGVSAGVVYSGICIKSHNAVYAVLYMVNDIYIWWWSRGMCRVWVCLKGHTQQEFIECSHHTYCVFVLKKIYKKKLPRAQVSNYLGASRYVRCSTKSDAVRQSGLLRQKMYGTRCVVSLYHIWYMCGIVAELKKKVLRNNCTIIFFWILDWKL